jgi:type I restriction enzyme R subunit
LNIALARPVFSPSDFIQIKGRGTRKHTFVFEDEQKRSHLYEKDKFFFFDFFANCAYFEDEFDYDHVLQLPRLGTGIEDPLQNEDFQKNSDEFQLGVNDVLASLIQTEIGAEGMKVDRMYERSKTILEKDRELRRLVDEGLEEEAVALVRERYENTADLYMTPEKIGSDAGVDRQLGWWEILQRVYGKITGFKSKDEILAEEAMTFISVVKPPSEKLIPAKHFFMAYSADPSFRAIIDQKMYGQLNTYPGFSVQELQELGKEWIEKTVQYVREYVQV